METCKVACDLAVAFCIAWALIPDLDLELTLLDKVYWAAVVDCAGIACNNELSKSLSWICESSMIFKYLIIGSICDIRSSNFSCFKIACCDESSSINTPWHTSHINSVLSSLNKDMASNCDTFLPHRGHTYPCGLPKLDISCFNWLTMVWTFHFIESIASVTWI